MEENIKQNIPEPDDERSTEPEAVPDSLEQLVDALRENTQLKDVAARAQADLVNYRRRAAQELDEAKISGTSRLLLKMISVLDDFERAIGMVPKDAVNSDWLDGLGLVQRKFQTFFESEGVSKINAHGQIFEPREHEALMYTESSELDDGIVLEVIRNGYKINERVLRAAQVTVSKRPPEEDNTKIQES
ncbi:MAG: nucleotide exchange factor GrpE [Chloroflexota bacterium]|nr:nucleotide exchange factor GrpE [Chloroflexota bacterium]